MICPKCRQDDQTQPVEALMERTPLGAIHPFPADPLARKLVPPPRPEPPPAPHEMALPALAEWGLTALVALGIALLATFLVAREWDGLRQIGLCLGVYLVATLVVSLTLTRLLQAAVIRRRAPIARQMRATYETVTLPRWEQAAARWKALGCCRRCQVVFLPDRDDYVPPERMSELLT